MRNSGKHIYNAYISVNILIKQTLWCLVKHIKVDPCLREKNKDVWDVARQKQNKKVARNIAANMISNISARVLDLT